MKHTRSWFFCLTPLLISSCYFIEHFESNEQTTNEAHITLNNDTVLGLSLGAKAGGINEEALATVHAVTSSVPPASIRPDPDLYARKLLLQHRSEGTVVARLMGSIDAFRPLLGGASEDFQKDPQRQFDATSLLATFSVSELICQGLVAPNSWQHSDWQSILPAQVSDWDTNLRFLIQSITGRTEEQITQELVTQLKTILDAEHDARSQASAAITSGIYDHQSYVPICSLLTIDPEAQNL